MIKHRFILRGADDAEIFAAIPTEHNVLTWEQWQPPLSRDRVLAEIDDSLYDCHAVISMHEKVGQPDVDKIFDEVVATERSRVMAEVAQCRRDAEAAANRVPPAARATTPSLVKFAELFDKLHDFEDVAMLERARAEAMGRFEALRERVDLPMTLAQAAHAKFTEARQGLPTAADPWAVVQWIVLHCDVYRRELVARFSGEQKFVKNDALDLHLWEMVAILLKVFSRERWLRLGEPDANLTCPVGVPFASYTVEMVHAGAPIVVNVVEGKAWVVGADTVEPSVRRVVEMVSQMLTERNLNPRSETRVIVREVDPAHAARTRRDEAKGEAKIRTIKFDVSPPRYLRQAAQRILSSPKRAHWVIGHWRNQAWGQGHQLRRETWIGPHIRGLGEAGPIVSKVAAPERQDPPTLPSLH